MAKPRASIYDETLAEIERSYKSGDIARARRLVEEELAMPYIPSKYQPAFVSWQKQLAAEERSQASASVKGKDELLGQLNGGDTALALEAVTSLPSFAIKGDDFAQIGAFLANRRAPRVFKALLFQALVDQKVDFAFDYFSDRSVKINPFSSPSVKGNEALVATVKEVEALLRKNPSALELCLQLCVFYFMYTFPKADHSSPAELAADLVAYALHALGDGEKPAGFVAGVLDDAIAQNGSRSF